MIYLVLLCILVPLIVCAICAGSDATKPERRKTARPQPTDRCPPEPIPWDDGLDVSKLEVRHESAQNTGGASHDE